MFNMFIVTYISRLSFFVKKEKLSVRGSHFLNVRDPHTAYQRNRKTKGSITKVLTGAPLMFAGMKRIFGTAFGVFST
jgi:hypothetical protein